MISKIKKSAAVIMLVTMLMIIIAPSYNAYGRGATDITVDIDSAYSNSPGAYATSIYTGDIPTSNFDDSEYIPPLRNEEYPTDVTMQDVVSEVKALKDRRLYEGDNFMLAVSVMNSSSNRTNFDGEVGTATQAATDVKLHVDVPDDVTLNTSNVPVIFVKDINNKTVKASLAGKTGFDFEQLDQYNAGDDLKDLDFTFASIETDERYVIYLPARAKETNNDYYSFDASAETTDPTTQAVNGSEYTYNVDALDSAISNTVKLDDSSGNSNGVAEDNEIVKVTGQVKIDSHYLDRTAYINNGYSNTGEWYAYLQLGFNTKHVSHNLDNRDITNVVRNGQDSATYDAYIESVINFNNFEVDNIAGLATLDTPTYNYSYDVVVDFNRFDLDDTSIDIVKEGDFGILNGKNVSRELNFDSENIIPSSYEQDLYSGLATGKSSSSGSENVTSGEYVTLQVEIINNSQDPIENIVVTNNVASNSNLDASSIRFLQIDGYNNPQDITTGVDVNIPVGRSRIVSFQVKTKKSGSVQDLNSTFSVTYNGTTKNFSV